MPKVASRLDLKSLSVWEKRELVALLEEMESRRKRRLIHSMYPERGPLRRELYARHMQFFRLGAKPGINERGFMAANRVGKTWGAGGYELTLHLTGDYPEWWEGRRFAHPVDAWAAGDTAETTRDIIQRCLLGPIDEFGTGLIPGRIAGRRTDTAACRRRRGRYGRGAPRQRRHQPARLQELRPGPPQIPGHGQARDLGRRGTAGRRAQRMPAAPDDGRRPADADLHAALRHFGGRVPLHQGSRRCPIW